MEKINKNNLEECIDKNMSRKDIAIFFNVTIYFINKKLKEYDLKTKGKINNSSVIDLTNKQFGRWVVIKQGKRYNNKIYWWCKCSCEKQTIKEVSGCSLKRGLSTNCGCLKSEKTSKIFKKHGMTGTRIYSIWKGIKTRCFNQNDISYPNYGGRGINVCNEWNNKESGFINFYNWSMNNGYKENLSIDRINVNGNYEPNNCRWTTRKIQANNTRKNHFITLNGKTKLLHEWSDEIGITPSNVLARIKRNLNDDEILSKQKFKNNKNLIINGKEYTRKEIAEIADMDISTIHKRIEYGITDERIFKHVKSSKYKYNGEIKIKEYLDKNNIYYSTQFYFKDCKNIKPLRFDFAIFEDREKTKIKMLIEYQGKQHFKPIDFAGKGKEWAEEQFNITQYHDKIKYKYCIDNNIKLITISYLKNKEIIKILDGLI